MINNNQTNHQNEYEIIKAKTHEDWKSITKYKTNISSFVIKITLHFFNVTSFLILNLLI